jgi:solute carrier family 25 (mitochondrial folate transporter), member 32
VARAATSVSDGWIHFGSAVTAGATADVLCNPMFVIRTRIQTEALHYQLRQRGGAGGGGAVHQALARPSTTMWATARGLLREGGLPIFWRGMTANLLGLSHVAVQFPLYEWCKLQARARHEPETALDLLLASGVSKLAASSLTYPHEVIRSRMMDARSSAGSTSASGFVRTCREIFASGGWRGFYVGLPISLVRVIPNTCVTFVTYELVVRGWRNELEQYTGDL